MVILILIFVVIPTLPPPAGAPSVAIDLGLPAYFYGIIFAIIGFILLFVFITQHFDYWKIERNEIYHKSGVIGQATRYPVKSLRMHQTIPDIFEYIALRAGSLTLIPSKDQVIHLNTVLNIKKKAAQIDDLLSRMRVEIDDHAD